jgi:glycosyltransferase involved in cell wall biosynthesis
MINTKDKVTLIAVDARILNSHPFRGSTRHLCSFLSCLGADKVVLLSNKLIDPKEFGLDGFVVKVFGFSNYLFWEQVSLPIWLIQNKNVISYLYSPNHTSPIYSPVKKIIAIYDLIYLRYLISSNPLRKVFIGSLYRAVTTIVSIFQSSKVITISQFTKRELTKFFKLPSKNISIVVPPFFKAPVFLDPPLLRNRVLMVSGLMKHKNALAGIEGFFKSRLQGTHKLTIVGVNPVNMMSCKYYELIDWQLNISDDDISRLYAQSEILLFPSIIEGFGIPLLEAMEMGVKVCCSGNTVFPEICEGNATYFDPRNIDDIAFALEVSAGKTPSKSQSLQVLNRYDQNVIRSQVRFFMEGL